MSIRSLKELSIAVASGPPYSEEFLEELTQDARAGARQLHEACVRRIAAARQEDDRLETMLAFEYEAMALGFRRVAGVDEAGRGPLAGPIVAAAVVLSAPLRGLNDSKQLTELQRETLFDALEAGGHDIGVGIVESEEIDRMGIQAANYAAMAAAVAGLRVAADYLLVDGFNVPGLVPPQLKLVKGDSRSLSIAAASIVAKVTRDRIMYTLHKQYPEYGFGTHKGYGTEDHLDAIRRLGPCPAHRKSFAPLAQPLETQSLFDQEG